EAQMADDLGAGTAVELAQAHFREDGLDSGEQQAAVVPGGERRGGAQEVAAGARDAGQVGQGGVGVDESPDDAPEGDGAARAGGAAWGVLRAGPGASGTAGSS